MAFQKKRNENIFDKLRDVFVKDLALTHIQLTICILLMAIDYHPKMRSHKPIILRFARYRDREIVLSNAYKLAGAKRRNLSDLPVSLKKEKKRLATEAFHIKKNEKLKTRIKEKGQNVYLEVRKESAEDSVDEGRTD